MKEARKFTGIVLATLTVAFMVVFALKAPAGLLEPTSPPGSTMHTLDEIYANTLNGNAGSTDVVVPPEAAATPRGKSYLWIEGVPGESTERERENWIEIFGFNYELAQEPRDFSGGGGGGGRANLSEITFVKQIDKTSPALSLHCCKGDHIDHVYIETTEASTDDIPNVLLRIELDDVRVQRLAPRVVYRGGEYVMVEEVALNYAKIKWIYTAYDPKGGAEIFEQGWDIVMNEQL